MNLQFGSIALFFLSIILGVIISVQQKKEIIRLSEAGDIGKKYVLMDDVFEDGLTIWWGGISGVFPKYIGKKGLKGLGWEEFPVYKVKAELRKKYGLKIVDWMIPPSRLNQEFQSSKRPICIYPYRWKNAAQVFTGERKEYISYVLDYSGEETSSILIRKSEINKYISYFKTNGNFNFTKLLNSRKFRTAIIKGEKYDKYLSSIIKITSDGDWKIAEKHSKNIKVMVASSNSQLLKMLDAKRIDFVLEQLISSSDYLKTGVDRDNIQSLIYHQTGIQSIKDPNLVHHSVRCNLHPLNKRIVPTINKIITASGGWYTKANWDQHRAKFDLFFIPLAYWANIQGRLQGEIEKIGPQWWYKEFNLNNELGEAFPTIARSEPLKKNSSIEKKYEKKIDYIASRDTLYKVIKQNGHLIIVDESFYSSAKIDWVDFSVDTDSNYLSAKELPHLISADVKKILKTVTPKDMEFDEILATSGLDIQKLTVIGAGMNASQLANILNRYKKLHAIHVLLGQQGMEKFVVNYKLDQVSELSLVGMNLLDFQLSKKLRKSKLTYLNLSGSMMQPTDLAKILEQHRTTIKELNLEDMAGDFGENASKTFDKKSWHELKMLNLAGNRLSGERLDRVIFSLSHKLESLRIQFNFLEPQHFRFIFSNCFKLKTLAASGSFLSDTSGIKIPDHIENLELNYLLSSNEEIEKVEFPYGIKKFHFSTSQGFGNRSLEQFMKVLGPKLEYINLGNFKGDIDFLNKSFRNTALPNLKHLTLNEMQANDETLYLLADRYPLIESLELRSNLISDQSIAGVALFPNLKHLNLSDNFLTEKGVSQLLDIKDIKEKLQSLSVSGSLSLDVSSLINKLPANLKELDISGFDINDRDALALAEGFPKSIRSLYWSARLFDQDSLANFITLMPPKIEELSYLSTKDGDANYRNLINALPNTLRRFSFSTRINKFDQGKILFPNSMKLLNFAINFNGNYDISDQPTHSIYNFIQGIPAGLSFLRIGSLLSDDMRKMFTHKPRSWFLWDSIKPKNIVSLPTNNLSAPGLNLSQIISALNQNPKKIYIPSIPKTSIEKGKITPKYIKDPRLFGFYIYGAGITDEFLEEMIKMNLSQVVSFSIANTQLTGKSILKLLNSVSKDTHYIDLTGSMLSLEDIDSVIEALPPRLISLVISGSKFGQKGYQKFRDWRDKEKIKRGFAPRLKE